MAYYNRRRSARSIEAEERMKKTERRREEQRAVRSKFVHEHALLPIGGEAAAEAWKKSQVVRDLNENYDGMATEILRRRGGRKYLQRLSGPGWRFYQAVPKSALQGAGYARSSRARKHVRVKRTR